jgi:hypothetical protein
MKKSRLISFLAVLALLGLLPVTAVCGQAAMAAPGDPILSHEITVNSVDNGKYVPSVAYNPVRQEFLAVWHTTWGGLGTRDIRGQRLSLTGKLLGTEFTVYSNFTHDAFQPSLAYDPENDRYLVTFVYNTSTNPTNMATDNTDLYGQLVNGNGSLSGTAFSIITWPNQQLVPKVVYAGGMQKQFVIVWNNTYTGGSPLAYVSVKHINPDGSFTGAAASWTYSEGANNLVNPDITYNIHNNEFMVVWDRVAGSDDIWAARLQGAYGTLGSPFAVAGWTADESLPSVDACNVANKYLVAWQSDQDTGGSDYAIYGYTINGDGSLDTVFMIDDTTSPETQPDVACDASGRNFLVAYAQRWTSTYYGISARKVYPNASMETAFVITPPGNHADRTKPAVVHGPSNFLVAWENIRDSTTIQDIHARLVAFYAQYLPVNPR